MKIILCILILLNSLFVSAQFQGDYDVSNWTLTNQNGNGTIVTTDAPNSITLIGTDGLSGSGNTNYEITIPATTSITFDWSYTTTDGASYDYPNIIINNGVPVRLTGYNTSGGSTQSGTMTVDVEAEDTFAFNMYSTDNIFGPGSVTISSFIVSNLSTPSSLSKFGFKTSNTALKVNKNGAVGVSQIDEYGNTKD